MGFGWRPYVSVAARRVQAAQKMNALRKKGHNIQPVEIEGRKIARTFWGESWCKHLEAFSDFANRLPRGRTYVCNGSVCHLLITSGEVKAIVSGSELYDVKIKIKELPATKWKAVKERCSGQIGSLLELLQGRLSHSVMAVVTNRVDGLFPSPSEIKLECSCPDWATMCKHVAAVLYGVGARLDQSPELLFLLRGVDHEELIEADAVAATALTSPSDEKGRSRRRIATDDLEDVFGIELLEENSDQSLQKNKRKASLVKAVIPQIIAEPEKGKRAKKVVASKALKEDKPPTAKGVRDLRFSLGLTPSRFALLIGVTVATVNNWESKRGRLNLQPRTLSALSTAMQLTKEQALKRLKKMK